MKLKQYIPVFFERLGTIAPNLGGYLALNLFRMPQSPKRSEEELNFWLTGQVASLASKRECRYWGSGDRVIFLVHGWESRGATYFKFIQKFVADGYKVYAWDGPAHGSSKQRFTDLFNFTQALSSDIRDLGVNVDTIIGHSFGGACIGILNDFIELPKKTVIIASPSSLHTALNRFKRMIKLNQKSYDFFVELCEEKMKRPIDDLSLCSRRIDLLSDCLIIHDKEDRDIPFEDYLELKKVWAKAKFFSTSGLGHKRIIKSDIVADKILEFIR